VSHSLVAWWWAFNTISKGWPEYQLQVFMVGWAPAGLKKRRGAFQGKMLCESFFGRLGGGLINAISGGASAVDLLRALQDLPVSAIRIHTAILSRSSAKVGGRVGGEGGGEDQVAAAPKFQMRPAGVCRGIGGGSSREGWGHQRDLSSDGGKSGRE